MTKKFICIILSLFLGSCSQLVDGFDQFVKTNDPAYIQVYSDRKSTLIKVCIKNSYGEEVYGYGTISLISNGDSLFGNGFVGDKKEKFSVYGFSVDLSSFDMIELDLYYREALDTKLYRALIESNGLAQANRFDNKRAFIEADCSELDLNTAEPLFKLW